MFAHEIIKRLSQNGYIKNGVSAYDYKPAIFPYYAPTKVSKPYILFTTESYDIKTRGETRILVISYVNNELTNEEGRRMAEEIVNSIDNQVLESDTDGMIRIYLSGNPEIVISGEDSFVRVKFILRGDIKLWGIV